MEIEFEEEGGRLVGRKVVSDRLDALVGILRLPVGTDAAVDELRGPRPTQQGHRDTNIGRPQREIVAQPLPRPVRRPVREPNE